MVGAVNITIKNMTKDVVAYIKKQKSPQKQICQKLRRIIKTTFPGIKEEVKLGAPFFGDKFYIVGLKDSVNIGFSVEGLLKKDRDLFTGKGKVMRHLKFRDVKEIDEKHLIKLLKLVKRKAKCSC
jgi:hypothetical protein